MKRKWKYLVSGFLLLIVITSMITISVKRVEKNKKIEASKKVIIHENFARKLEQKKNIRKDIVARTGADSTWVKELYSLCIADTTLNPYPYYFSINIDGKNLKKVWMPNKTILFEGRVISIEENNDDSLRIQFNYFEVPPSKLSFFADDEISVIVNCHKDYYEKILGNLYKIPIIGDSVIKDVIEHGAIIAVEIKTIETITVKYDEGEEKRNITGFGSLKEMKSYSFFDTNEDSHKP